VNLAIDAPDAAPKRGKLTIEAPNAFLDEDYALANPEASPEQVLQGINAGVYYYLTKPYDDGMLLAIVKSALRDTKTKNKMKEEVRGLRRMLGLMEQSDFRFRTLEEAKSIAYYIASCFPEPEAVVFGLNELLINAVEHGNLGITYAEKTKLILNGSWLQEIECRSASPEYSEKTGRLSFKATKDVIAVTIKDEGSGFDWNKYLELSADRATDPHGRGIAATRMMCFHSMEYLGAGNEVVCKIYLNKPHGQNEWPFHVPWRPRALCSSVRTTANQLSHRHPQLPQPKTNVFAAAALQRRRQKGTASLSTLPLPPARPLRSLWPDIPAPAPRWR
jgi:Histidine kinase-like ATPase domain